MVRKMAFYFSHGVIEPPAGKRDCFESVVGF
jgi:hypothetical protein